MLSALKRTAGGLGAVAARRVSQPVRRFAGSVGDFKYWPHVWLRPASNGVAAVRSNVGGASGRPRYFASLSVSDQDGTADGAARQVAEATLDNTYIMGIREDDLAGQPEMVRRVFMLRNGRRQDLTKAQKQ